MAVKKTPPTEAVSREVLTKELSGLEKRLDTKIEVTAQSLKEYIDSRTQQTQTSMQQMQTGIEQLQTSVQQLGEKLDHRVDGLVEMIERGFGKQAETDARLNNHKRRIDALEQKAT